MRREYFEALEYVEDGRCIDLEPFYDQLAFNEQGLLPVITQDATTKKVLMFAWMNREALELTVERKRMTYWSRSRQELWLKGETSGHTQALVSMSFDCDGDAILCEVEQKGAACHTGRDDCFYFNVDADQKKVRVSNELACSSSK